MLVGGNNYDSYVCRLVTKQTVMNMKKLLIFIFVLQQRIQMKYT